MDDAQIIMEILLDSYKSEINDMEILKQEKNKKLKSVSDVDYNFVCRYLVNNKLLKNKIYCTVDPHTTLISSQEITNGGLYLVEKFIDKCILKMEIKYNVLFYKSLSYFDKLSQLEILWNANFNLYNRACELLISILWHRV